MHVTPTAIIRNSRNNGREGALSALNNSNHAKSVHFNETMPTSLTVSVMGSETTDGGAAAAQTEGQEKVEYEEHLIAKEEVLEDDLGDNTTHQEPQPGKDYQMDFPRDGESVHIQSRSSSI